MSSIPNFFVSVGSSSHSRSPKSQKNWHLRFILIMPFFLFSFYFFLPHSASAENFESERYRIEYGNINIGGDNLTSKDYNLSVSLGQTAAQSFQSAGYLVRAGFQYWHSIIPFRFSISNVTIDLGTLSTNTPSVAKTNLTVYFGSAGQYQVTAVEDHPLSRLNGKIIPDTSCNAGAESCTETSANLWTSPSAYGFGYSITGDDVPSDFVDERYYRPFPTSSSRETPAVVMSNVNVGKRRQSTVTFKANIAPTQEVGNYETIVKFTATPSF